jgi:hypothetical protein
MCDIDDDVNEFELERLLNDVSDADLPELPIDTLIDEEVLSVDSAATKAFCRKLSGFLLVECFTDLVETMSIAHLDRHLRLFIFHCAGTYYPLSYWDSLGHF